MAIFARIILTISATVFITNIKTVFCGFDRGDIHRQQLVEDFLEQAGLLGAKLAVLLVQLPPKLAFDESAAAAFFDALTERTSAMVACEPRQTSWFTPGAGASLDRRRIARVAVDPAICAEAASPGGWRGLSYWRLHGSPQMYRSSYSDEALEMYAGQIRKAIDEGCQAWCICSELNHRG